MASAESTITIDASDLKNAFPVTAVSLRPGDRIVLKTPDGTRTSDAARTHFSEMIRRWAGRDIPVLILDGGIQMVIVTAEEAADEFKTVDLRQFNIPPEKPEAQSPLPPRRKEKLL